MTDNKIKLEAGRFEMKGQNSALRIKRGEVSWAYFTLTYGLALTFSVGVISVLDCIGLYKISLMIIAATLLFRVCFYWRRSKNMIVKFFNKLSEREEVG